MGCQHSAPTLCSHPPTHALSQRLPRMPRPTEHTVLIRTCSNCQTEPGAWTRPFPARVSLRAPNKLRPFNKPHSAFRNGGSAARLTETRRRRQHPTSLRATWAPGNGRRTHTIPGGPHTRRAGPRWASCPRRARAGAPGQVGAGGHGWVDAGDGAGQAGPGPAKAEARRVVCRQLRARRETASSGGGESAVVR